MLLQSFYFISLVGVLNLFSFPVLVIDFVNINLVRPIFLRFLLLQRTEIM